MNYTLLIPVGIVSFLCGLGGYLLALWFGWEQTISTGDLRAVFIWGGLAYLLTAAPLYLVAIRAVARRVSRLTWALYPICCMALFFIPSAFIMLLFGGSLRYIVSPEAQLFYGFFLTSGFAFGVGYWLVENVSAIRDLLMNNKK